MTSTWHEREEIGCWKIFSMLLWRLILNILQGWHEIHYISFYFFQPKTKNLLFFGLPRQQRIVTQKTWTHRLFCCYRATAFRSASESRKLSRRVTLVAEAAGRHTCPVKLVLVNNNLLKCRTGLTGHFLVHYWEFCESHVDRDISRDITYWHQ